ncbi:MAG: Sporulation initiation inhibitor protein Soj [Phycisphaerae bacterium]|nr:Sporulation initiation inhibitor protein Soj [Phycisphaerae bacterium]
MRSIAVINQKGGVGKTTTSVNVAAALALAGQRVLLIDLDPQAHTTLHLGVEPADDDSTVYDVLIRAAPLTQARRTVRENLALIPAHLDLVATEIELAERPGRELILRDALRTVRGEYDLAIVDCPPSLGLLTVNALAAADEVVIPLQPHFLGLQGLGKLLETVSMVRGVLAPTLRVSGVVLCMYESGTRLAQEVVEDIRRFIASAAPTDPWSGACVFRSCIRKNIKLAESPSFGQTIFDYAPQSHGAEDYRSLAAELLALSSAAAPPKPGAPPPASESDASMTDAPSAAAS